MALSNVRNLGHTSKTTKHFVLDSGFVIKNPVIDETTKEIMGGEGISITAGGSTITLEQEYRRKEADGINVDTKCYMTKVSETGNFTFNFKEWTADVIKLAINGKTLEDTLTYKVIGTKDILEDDDFVSLLYVGRYGKDNPADIANQPVMIYAKNCYSSGGFSTEFTENGEAVIPIQFNIVADVDQFGTRSLPIKFYIPDLKFGFSVSVLDNLAQPAEGFVRFFDSNNPTKEYPIYTLENGSATVIVPVDDVDDITTGIFSIQYSASDNPFGATYTESLPSLTESDAGQLKTVQINLP